MSALAPEPQSVAHFHLPSYLLGLVTALMLLGMAMFLLRRPEPTAMQLQPAPTVPLTAPTVTPASQTPAPLTVFVSGAVHRPGLYTLPAGARIGTAITAAGGLLPDVDAALVNQAQPLTDGAQLHIPLATTVAADPPLAAATLPEGSPPAEPAAAGLTAGLTAALPTPTALVPTAAVEVEGSLAPVHAQPGAAASARGLIDVNTATATELESLPGIGPAKAQGIIDNRPYASVEELDRVPGIGPATLDRLRPLVTTG